MCGVAGAVSYTKKINRQVIDKMLDSIHHRGPDGDGMFVREQPSHRHGLILGHKRLKIIDLSDRAKQPMSIDNDRLVISYNGEIYNHIDLRREIGNVKWISSSDTETVVESYNKWGINFLSKLNGMWSFAIWDETIKTLIISRDRFGIKPMYYSEYDGVLYFASEIKSFFNSPVPIKPNYKTISDFLCGGVIDHSSDTWFKNIYSLPPGSYLSWKGGKFTIKKYYYLPDYVDEDNSKSIDKTIEDATNLIVDSVTRCTYSDRKVGVHFSGGIDSSVVATKTSEALNGNIDTYTYGYNEEKYSEIPFAKNVSDALGVKNFQSILKNEDLDKLLLQILIEQDEPYTSVRVVSEHKLYSDYKSNGATVILESAGGDEVSAGYSRYLWPWYLDSVLDNGPQRAISDFINISSQISEKDNFKKFILGTAASHLRPSTCTSDGVPFLNYDLLDRSLVKISTPIEFDKPFKSNLRNSQFLDFTYIKLPRFLRFLDRASMSSSREARLPLLDYRIVELGFSALNEAKINNNHQRYYMKKVASNLLSSEYMPNKRSIVDPQRDWMKTGRLSEMTDDIFNSKSFCERGNYNSVSVQQEYEKYKSSKTPMNSFGLFQLLMTEMWFENII